MEFKHIPIMVSQCLDGLNIKKNGVYVDATLGGAGHSSKIADILDKDGILIGIDKDLDAIQASKIRLKNKVCKVILIKDDFKNIKQILKDLEIKKVDGILADLGVSSYQIDEASRGFSYMKDGDLDMRMDKNSVLDAKKVVNNYSEKELTRIFYEYGEEKYSKSIAKKIVEYRKIKPIATTLELRQIVEQSIPNVVIKKNGAGVSKKVFQSIRIEVNNELGSLRDLLDDFIDVLKPKGRICIITFHSLEDRLVKNKFNLESRDCICDKSLPICVCNHKATIKLITKKPITPNEREIKENPRSSSSKLRIAEKI